MGTIRQRLAKSALTLCVFGVFISISAHTDTAVDKALDCAVVDGADLLLSIDLVGLQNSQIQKKAAELKDVSTKNLLPENPLTDVKKRTEQLRDALGLGPDSVKKIVVSASTEGGTKMAPELRSMKVLMAVSLATPLTLDQIETGLTQLVDLEGGGKPTGRLTHRSVEMLAFDTGKTDAEGNTVRAMAAPIADGRVIYLGSEQQVRSGLDSYLSSQTNTASPLLAASAETIPKEAQIALVFIPTEALRERIRNHAAKAQQTNPMMANTMASVSGMEHLAFYLTADEVMDMALSLKFATPQEALEVKTMLDMMVLGMGKMTLMQAVGKTIPMIESLKCVQEGSSAAISMRVTGEDIAALAEVSANGGAGGGFPMPGNGGAPAQGIPAGE